MMKDSGYDSSSSEELEPNIPIVSPSNPYISEYKTQDIENNISCKNKVQVKFYKNDVGITIPNHNYDLAIELEETSTIVRGLCLFDFICNITYMIYGLYYPLLIAVISCCGYSGINTYNKKKIFCYLSYLYLQILIKATVLSYLITLSINEKIREDHSNSYPNNIFLRHLKGPIITSTILLAFQIGTTNIVNNFYKKIPDSPVYDYIVL